MTTYKKVFYYSSLSFLTISATAIGGILSFSGMLVIWPVLPVAFAAFLLFAIIEGEVHLQNTKSALQKLMKVDYLKKFLLKNFLQDWKAKNKPEINQVNEYLDAKEQLRHARTAEERKKLKAEVKEKKQKLMAYLYEEAPEDENDIRFVYQQTLQRRTVFFNFTKMFSACAGVLMGFASFFALTEAFETMLTVSFAFTPLLSPFVLIPMAITVGTAYALLTYNAITDMINHDLIKRWVQLVKDSLSDPRKGRTILLVGASVVFALLTATLTICTAGTWWTITNRLKTPLLRLFTVAVITCASGFFALANAIQSLQKIEKNLDAKRSNFVEQIKSSWQKFLKDENRLQRLNIGRFLVQLTFNPANILLYIAHLVSSGVTADRVPKVNPILSAVFCSLNEAIIDSPYYTFWHSQDGEHHEEADHQHSAIPTLMLNIIFSPLILLATLWDWWASQYNKGTDRETLTFKAAFFKHVQYNFHDHHSTHNHSANEPNVEHQNSSKALAGLGGPVSSTNEPEFKVDAKTLLTPKETLKTQRRLSDTEFNRPQQIERGLSI